ncbi:hypothetical protein CPC08DRAFT_765528 [Agrocybe pediades]|nr:hypothetical protein CPC08DRAFT_765528 [Agrocybe pediades]
MPTTNITRPYHSVASLTLLGNILITGSNPKGEVMNGTKFATDSTSASITIPMDLKASSIKVALMDLRFSSHAFHSSSGLVFMEGRLSPDRKKLSILSPPNNRVYPPGPGYIFLTAGNVTSTGAHIMVGNGLPPPVLIRES